MWWPRLLLAGSVLACSSLVSPVPPPVAGLAHPQVARVGVPVTFDASTSAVAAPTSQAPGSIDRFHLAIADGSPAVDLAGPSTQHVFDRAGSFGVVLTITDGLGRSASVSSQIQVLADFPAFCQSATDCGGLPCDKGACRIYACGGDPACPLGLPADATHCNQNVCASTPGETGTLGGDDAAVLQADGQ